ncbi:MAG: DNA mismatch repair protein MutS [Thermodesulfovibrionales bacterium]|nr:DNA mismatch repair protein MutS [Thermodesulfovibrionales bacterium]
MKQYFSIKERFKDAILFFRLGDFYEMFDEDAKIASKILQITLTTRNKDTESPIPMCGIPYFSADSYISRLIKEGYKVAICEQLEEPKHAKGIVHREVVRVITPGTYNPENPKENSFVLSFFKKAKKIGIAAADISTGEFFIFETEGSIENEIARFNPKEVLCPESRRSDLYFQSSFEGYYVTFIDDMYYEYSEAYKTVLKYFGVTTLSGFGCENMEIAISSAGALLSYLLETQRVVSFQKIQVFNPTSLMLIDSTSLKNLEIIENLKDKTSEGSLLWVLDNTLTPMGGRYLRRALLNPLTDISEICRRNEAVEFLFENFNIRENLKAGLKDIQDIERLTMKILYATATPRDLQALKGSLQTLPKIKEIISSEEKTYLSELSKEIEDFDYIVNLISNTLVDSPPISVSDGGIIRSGFNQRVDELREISSSAKDFISKLEAQERQKTSIQSLKIGYNRVFGYYIEVTKTNIDLVPPHYIRKQTLVNAERFITEELKEYEAKILQAESNLISLEIEFFNNLLDEVKHYSEALLRASKAIAVVDFLYSLASVAKKYDYVKPFLREDGVINITNGRHPVLERLISKENLTHLVDRFIPNDTYLDLQDNRLLIITGPNMAGKSTYMRQVALIVLLAQIGSFVPAKRAEIGVVDRIFTRIGAVDFIGKGQSTFMVEMAEVANILNNATDNSLVILDEVGRGTSTFDGVSIAWAVAEFLASEIKCRTLFATHYHELADIVFTVEGTKNYNAVVKEWGDEIIFLRKIERGSTDKSYGIQVARLAGIPQVVINRAKMILKRFEDNRFKGSTSQSQLSLFPEETSLKEDLLKLDLEVLTPEEAKEKLYFLKKKAERMIN